MNPSDDKTIIPEDSASNVNSRRKPRGDNARRRPKKSAPMTGSSRVGDPPKELPTPTSLSTKASPTRDDPFIIDEFMADGFEMFPITQIPTVVVNNSGYEDLVDQVYLEMSIDNRYLGQNIPISLFRYYCNQLLWHRLNFLDKSFSRAYDQDFDVLMNQLEFTVPRPILNYLDSIGEFTTPDGSTFRTDLLARPNANGDFGQYDGASSPTYETHPAPRVVLEQISADLTIPHVPNWTPRGVLTPNDVPAGQTAVANPNLLGYKISVPVDTRARPTLANLGFTAGANPTLAPTSGNFLTSPRTLTYVSNYLKASVKGFKLEPWTNVTKLGSSVIIAGLRPLDASRIPRGMKYSLSTFTSACISRASSQLVAGAFAAAFRIERVDTPSHLLRHTAYTFEDGMGNEVPPPAAYFAAVTVSSPFSSGNADIINGFQFRGNFLDRSAYLNTAVGHFRSNVPV